LQVRLTAAKTYLQLFITGDGTHRGGDGLLEQLRGIIGNHITPLGEHHVRTGFR
jgi:hypothetical protein